MLQEEGRLPENHKEKVKSSVEKVIGAKVTSRKLRKTPRDIEKEKFEKFISAYDTLVDRQTGMKDLFNLDMTSYDEDFLDTIEALIDLKFNEHQKRLIEFYIYDRVDQEGQMVGLEDPEGNLTVLSTPSDLFDYIEHIK